MTSRSEHERELLRRLARDQWVRLHGTPRVTVLAGGDYARSLWNAWLSLTDANGTLVEDHDVDRALRIAIDRAVSSPQAAVALLSSKEALTAWRLGRNDRDAAMVDEGWLDVSEPPNQPRVRDARQPFDLDARSAAEAALYEALEATPATKGRFQLNESLSVRFGSRAAEVDLLSRQDRIAIEIDGVHHFADPDCYRRDRRKDLLLQTQGLLVIRLLAEDVLRDPRVSVNVVCEGLAYRRGS